MPTAVSLRLGRRYEGASTEAQNAVHPEWQEWVILIASALGVFGPLICAAVGSLVGALVGDEAAAFIRAVALLLIGKGGDVLERVVGFLAKFMKGDIVRLLQKVRFADYGDMLVKKLKDFLYLVRDFLSWVLSGGERSLASDQLTMFFSGFMPSYGTARTFLGIVNDGGTWLDVRAFMHSQAYGNARQYVESFDWSVGNQKAQAETDAWLKVLTEEDEKLRAGSNLLAFVAPDNSPWLNKPPVTDAPRPVLPAAAEASALTRILVTIRRLPKSPWSLLFVATPAGESKEELERLRQRQMEYARQNILAIPEPQVRTAVKVDTLTIECKAQIEKNQQNGARCENDGYTLMERSLGYGRLVNPPKGKGLDGLFEKQGDMSAPNPMPQIVSEPPPGGKLVFIPETTKPPKPQYRTLNPQAAGPVAYPLFVVFEAKHISKGFDPGDTEGIKKEAKRRLGETCDGTQMSEPWSEKRIPQALNRKVKSGDMTRKESKVQYQKIKDTGYVRWMFICLPGPTGSSSKLFVLIDVVGAGMNLEQTSPHVPSQSESDISGSFE